MNRLIRRAVTVAATGSMIFAMAACQGSQGDEPTTDSEGTAVNSSNPETSAQIQIDGWESLPRSSTDYVGVILTQELAEGDGAGSRLIIQKGISSSQSAETHRDNLALDLQSQGVRVTSVDGRKIDGVMAAGVTYRNSSTSRIIQTWYVVKDGLRYTINLESEEGANEMSENAEKVLDNIVLGE